MTIEDLVREQNLGDTIAIDTVAKKIDVKVDGTSLVVAGDGTVSSPAENAADTPFTPAGGLVSTDTQAAIVELAGLLSGVQHTVITGIDLQPTGTPNQYTVVVTWTDSDGNAQTTTDPTPITITTQTVVSTDAGNLITAGGDGGAFYDGPVVSADAGNLIAAGADDGAVITGPGLKTAVEDHVLDDCPVTDMFGDPIGTVTMWQP